MTVIRVKNKDDSSLWINLDSITYYRPSTTSNTFGMTHVELNCRDHNGEVISKTIFDNIQLIHAECHKHMIEVVPVSFLDSAGVHYGSGFIIKKNVSYSYEKDGFYYVVFLNGEVVRTDKPVH